MSSPFGFDTQDVEIYKPPTHITCKYCDKPIFFRDRAVYLHHGVIGPGPKSGQPIVMDGEHCSGESIVHELCVAPFLLAEIIDSSEEADATIDSITEGLYGRSYTDIATQETLCVACEAKLDAD